jgi:hypothetical protein
MKHEEYNIQKQISAYLSIQYTKVLFLSDTVANIHLSFAQASRNKAIQKDGFSCPDLLVLHPNEFYKGLFIELKVKSPYKKNGELLKSDHLDNQQRAITELSRLGYYACFSVGFEQTKKIIDDYMNNNLF